jgi:integrase
MAKSKVINQHTFNDGKVVLYQLEDRPKKLWLCRLKVPNGAGYVYRGTGTSELYEARKFADALLDEMRIKVRLGQAVTGKGFENIYAEFEDSYRVEAPSAFSYDNTIRFLKTYALPYFSKSKITDLNESEIAKFFDWRRKNGKRKTPKNTSILHDMSCLKTLLDWSFRRGYIKSRIEIERPRNDAERRPHFDSKDWAKLTRFLREWVKQAEHKSGPILRDRIMLTNYVLILGNTGLRTGEARALRWRDIDTEPSESSDHDNVVLSVRGKTGAREVVARTAAVQNYLQRIWELRCSELSADPSRDELVFCHKDGKAIYSFKKGFSALICEAGVEFDHDGRKRTLYSLRHTYATFRLHEGVNHYVLARNMGTSVKMLENFYGHTSNRAMAEELTKTKAKKPKRLPWE